MCMHVQAMFFRNAVFDDNIMVKTVQKLAEDLPMLAGRVTSSAKSLLRMQMSQISIKNCNAGIDFKVVDASDVCMDDVNAKSWTMQNMTISSPKVPFYLPRLDAGVKFLRGHSPVCKIQLTHLKDGDILGISMSHMMTDGIHWPMFMKHFASRYRELARSDAQCGEDLLTWDGNKHLMTVEAIQENVRDSLPSGWKPDPFPVKAGLVDRLRSFSLLLSNSRKKANFDIVHVSRADLQQLKKAVQEEIGSAVTISTGDVVQSVASMMVHGAQNKPLVPQKPHAMLVLVQVPGVDKIGGYFGNAVHPMRVTFDQDESVPDTDMKVIAKLAGKIRTCTQEIRSNPTAVLQALHETDIICNTSLPKALGFLAGNRLPYVSCTTNYIGTLRDDVELDFGLGGEKSNGARYVQWLVTPLARDMNVIRPAAPPFEDGVFFHMALNPQDSKRLRNLSLFKTVLSGATIL
jgi:hypothetical protein